MKTVYNQKKVSINKVEDGVHTVLSLEAIQKASKMLSGEAFKLWLYLDKNQNKYTLGLSRADALAWGIGSTSSYYRAVKELIVSGYLQETSSNNFVFYELPKRIQK